MADKKVFEAASITSLDFDRTEVDSNIGSYGGGNHDGGNSTTTIVPPSYSLEFVEFDTGSFSRFELKIPSLPKEFTKVDLTLTFKPGTLHNSLDSVSVFPGSMQEYISASVIGSGSTVTLSLVVGYPGVLSDPSTPARDRIAAVKVTTIWKHDFINDSNYINSGKATVGGYDGIRNVDCETRDVRNYTEDIRIMFS